MCRLMNNILFMGRAGSIYARLQKDRPNRLTQVLEPSVGSREWSRNDVIEGAVFAFVQYRVKALACGRPRSDP